MTDSTASSSIPRGTQRRERVQFVLVAVCIFVFFFSAFRIGLVRGLQDTIADQAWGRAQFAIGAAITSMKHGGYGYTIAEPIRTVLAYAGLTGDQSLLSKLGETYPDNLRNATLIDKAIGKAAAFPSLVNRNVGVSGSGGDDIGLVDFVRLSFLLFGFNVLSFYLAYFALVGVSLACAVIAFRSIPGALAAIFVMGLGFPLIIGSSLMRPDIDGILDPRFLSTLSIVPAVHLALATLARLPLTRCNIALAIVQSCIFVFGYWIRSSAIWALLGLVLLAAYLAVRPLRSRHKEELWRLWPVGIVCAAAVIHLGYVAVALHPVYRTSNERPYHGLWHAMVYALQFHPNWKAKYASQFDNASYDEHPEVVAKKFLLRHPPRNPEAVYLTPDKKYIRTGVVEDIKRQALFEFLKMDPKFVLETYAIYNVRTCYRSLAFHLKSLRGMPLFAKLLTLGALLLLALLLWNDKTEMNRFVHGNVILTCGFVISLSYLVISAPGLHVVADQFLMLLALIAGWAVVAFVSLGKAVSSEGDTP